MLKHMEQDLLSERTKNQRKSNKLNQDYRKTFNEVRLCTQRVEQVTEFCHVYVTPDHGFSWKSCVRVREICALASKV